MSYMGQDNLKTNLSNLQRIYNWDLIIPAPIGGGSSDVLLLRAQSSTIPGRSVGAIQIPYKQGAAIQFPGKLTYSHEWTCTFVEGEDRKVHDAIYAWAQAVVNDASGIGNGDTAIKTDAYLVLLDTKDSTTSKIKLIGCFVSNIADVSLDYGTEDGVKYSVTFRYDRWEDAN